MRIQYMSDLHMEFTENTRFIKANECQANGDVLVLAGDTFYLQDIVAPKNRFWNWASKSFRQVLLVPGNHEFYGNGDVTYRGNSWQWMIRDNIGYYTMSVVSAQHKESVLNGAFATELGDYIADSRIDVWIYGHSHTNIDTIIGNTKIVTNQLGYVCFNEHLANGFDPCKVIQL